METGMTQVGLFDIALETVGLRTKGWTVETLNIKQIRESYPDWDSPKYLVDWLIEADVHVILIQGLHQGMIEMWHPSECQKELLRLEYHPGTSIPSYIRISCLLPSRLPSLRFPVRDKPSLPSFQR